ncbi:MAG TPA: TonB family protein [Aliidongia sp.]|nr:TonB family protein [Aliidongia sp.]
MHLSLPRTVSVAILLLCCTALGAHAGTSDTTVQAATPIDRPPPSYPPNEANAEGNVTVRFTVDIDGRVSNATVIKSDLPPIFSERATAAISTWRYHPKLFQGRPVEQTDNTIQLHFKPVAPESTPAFIDRPKPRYPREAFLAKQEGHVTVRFDVTELGLATNVRIEDSVPPGVFDQAAIGSTETWRFRPTLVDGRPRRVNDAVTVIPYTLADAILSPVVVSRPKLEYPHPALVAGVIGYCLARIRIADDGSVAETKLVDTYPPDTFGEACLNYIAGVKYQRPDQDTTGHVARDVEININFCVNNVRTTNDLRPGEWVRVEYTETAAGRVVDAKVIDTSGPDVSTASALQQVRGRQMAPIVENGVAVEKPGRTVVIVGPDKPLC